MTFSWEQRKIKEIFKVTRGYVLAATKTTSRKDNENRYPVYSSQTKDNGLMGYFSEYLYENAITWTTDGANAGTVNFRGGKFYCTNVCGVLLSDSGYANKMIAEALNRIAWRHVSKVGNPKLMNNVMSEIVLQLPLNFSEQKKISAILQTIDRLITLHQRNDFFVKAPKNLEISLQKTVAWEQRELGKTTQITMGQSPDGSTYSDSPSTYILVQGNADLKDGWVVPRIWTTQATKQATAGDLIMSVRAPAGAMGKTAYDVVLGRGVAALKGSEFIYQYLVKMDSDGYWKKLSCGSTFESLNSDNIYAAEISIPSTGEQQKIGQFFESLDQLITLHQRERLFLILEEILC